MSWRNILKRFTGTETPCLLFGGRSDLIVDKRVVAASLNLAVRANLLYKHGSKYYSTPRDFIVSAKPKAPKAAAVKRTVSKKYGSLFAGSDLGNVALVLLVRNRLMASSEIGRFLQKPLSRPPALLLRMLKSAGYADSITVKGVLHFRWSWAYDYPFSKFQPSDLASLRLDPDFSVQSLGVARG